MGKLLRNAPVEILEIRARDDVRCSQRRRLELRFKLDIECEIVFRPQVREWLRILWRERLPESLKRFEHHNPRRNACREILRQKWPERLIFPRLNITCAPVVHQD